jgi:hypothetical protein
VLSYEIQISKKGTCPRKGLLMRKEEGIWKRDKDMKIERKRRKQIYKAIK